MKRATFPALVFALLLAGASAFAAPSLRETPVRFRRGEWDFSAGTSYFGATGNYTSDGNVGFPSGNSYRLIDVDLSTRYTLSSSWAVFGGVTIGNAESKGLDATRSNSGLSDSIIGVQTTFLLGSVEMIPEFSQVFPFEKVTATQDDVMISEGVTQSQFLLRFQSVLESVTLFGHIGTNFRGGGRSNLMPWSLGGEFNSAGRFHFGGRLFGFQSISDDSDIGSTAREADRATTSLRVNGGALAFYGLNPQLVDSELYVVYRLTRDISLGIDGGGTLTGKNAAQGFHLGAALTYRFQTQPAQTRRRGTPGLSIDPTVDKFQEDTEDGIDQKLFRPEPKRRTKPAPEQPSADESETQLDFDQAPQNAATPAADNVRAKGKARKKQREKDPFLDSSDAAPAHGEDPMFRERKTPPPVDDEEQQNKMQEQLDKAEMTIQLKVDKKRRRK